MAKITIIVACGLNRAIGKDNKLLWKLPEDMKLFKANTLGKTVLMGRLTAESVGRALPNRRNLVLTSRDSAPYPGQEAVRSLDEAISMLGADEELCVIGGERVYAEALPLADRIKLTIVCDEPDADAFFPRFDATEWRLRERRNFAPTEDDIEYTYAEYIRNAPHRYLAHGAPEE